MGLVGGRKGVHSSSEFAKRSLTSRGWKRGKNLQRGKKIYIFNVLGGKSTNGGGGKGGGGMKSPLSASKEGGNGWIVLEWGVRERGRIQRPEGGRKKREESSSLGGGGGGGL